MACGGSSDNDPPPAEITPSEAKTSRSDAAALGNPGDGGPGRPADPLRRHGRPPNWWKSTNWSSAAPLDTWYGVTTNAQGRVTRLVLKTNHLTGPLPTALGDLAHLRELSLWGNHVSGEIPAALGNLAQLRTLALSHNRLQGPIPVELGALGALEVLFLNDNQLRGVLPAGLAARNLRTLYLANNSGLTGCLPEALRAVTYHDLGTTGVPGTGLFWCSLPYDLLQTDGTVAAAGEYAFLETVGDTDTAVENFGHSVIGAAELRIHTTDADDNDQTTFYTQIEVGSRFDYQINGLDCGFRFAVDTVGTANPRVYTLTYQSQYGMDCGGLADDATAARDVTFAWFPEAGIPQGDGTRTMMEFEPITGPITIRVHSWSPVTVTIPAGMTVVHRGIGISEMIEGEGPDGWDGSFLILKDVLSGATLEIDPTLGVELERTVPTTSTDDVGALFDQIIQSITTQP